GNRTRSVATRDLTDVDGARLGGRLRGVLDRGDVGLPRLDLATGGELDVGLAEQRLRAQDRPGVRGDRRVLRLDLDGRPGRVADGGVGVALALGRQAKPLHLADGHAPDPDV